jgi:chemotaxis protein MotA
VLAIEQHIEKPEESTIFQEFPHFHKDHHAVEFLCDYLRLIALGTNNPHTLEDLMNQELEVHHKADHDQAHAIQNLADGVPALGIVAAVLGVIKTMGAISEGPEVLGEKIAGALVGTFFGVWVAYGYFGPMAAAIGAANDQDGAYYTCLKSGMLAYLNGSPPAVCIEFARKAIPAHVRPDFFETEQAVGNLPPVK